MERIRIQEEQFRARMLKMQTDHFGKVAADEEKYSRLMKEKEQMKIQVMEEIKQLQEEHVHNQRVVAIQRDQERRNLENEERQLNLAIQDIKTDAKKQRAEKEDSAWRQIDLLSDQNKHALAFEIERGMEAKAKLTMELKRLRDKNVLKDSHLRTLEEKRVNFEDNKQQTLKLKANIEQQDQEILDRENTLVEAKGKILNLKKKIQELEKFKFVLHFKINELKNDIGPRELRIKELNQQCNTMHSELKHYNRVKEKLDLICDHLRMRHEGLTHEIEAHSKELLKQEEVKKMSRDDMQTAIIRLHQIWVLQQTKQNFGSLDATAEYGTRRKLAENKVKCLNEQLRNDQKNFEKENKRILKENVTLIQEINHLKAE
jgi:hypothetical protein